MSKVLIKRDRSSDRGLSTGYVLETTTRIPAPLDQVFPFFSDARNLEVLTPPMLRFEILTDGELEMKEGLLIDYRIRIHGVPVRWKTEISSWEPPRRFTDQQLRGPYSWWIHDHFFEADGDETLMTDRVSYGVLLGPIAHPLVVKGDLRKIFEYREATIVHLFRTVPAVPREPTPSFA